MHFRGVEQAAAKIYIHGAKNTVFFKMEPNIHPDFFLINILFLYNFGTKSFSIYPIVLSYSEYVCALIFIINVQFSFLLMIMFLTITSIRKNIAI